MILQGCYDEGMSEINEKAVALQLGITSRNGTACADLANSYSMEAKKMEADISKMAEHQPGWLAADLNLNFARQRLDNLRMMQKECR
jgi:hypothetical protein